MDPVRHHQDAVHLSLFGKGPDLLTILPGTGRGQQVNGPSRHPILHGKLGGVSTAGVPKFGGQTPLVQGDAVQNALGITAENDNSISLTDARRLGQPVSNPGKPQSGRNK